jgi:hypothetical protein
MNIQFILEVIEPKIRQRYHFFMDFCENDHEENIKEQKRFLSNIPCQSSVFTACNSCSALKTREARADQLSYDKSSRLITISAFFC